MNKLSLLTESTYPRREKISVKLGTFKDDQKLIFVITSPTIQFFIALHNTAFVLYSVLIICSLAQKSVDTTGNTLKIVFPIVPYSTRTNLHNYK